MPSIGAAWRAARDRFRAAGLGTPELDARILAREAFGLDTLGLIAHEHEPANGDALMRLEALAARRLAREPVARILGHKEFYGLDFVLNSATLVPRPETELLVDLALEALGGKPEPRVLDLGTGSGCIAIAILANLPGARAVAVDVSAEALRATRANADANGVGTRIELCQGSWFGPLSFVEQFDAIVSNPPYVETGAIAGLEEDVRSFDPVAALDGGKDGLDAYREIAAGARRHLRPGGVLLLEIGAGQGAAVSALLAGSGYCHIAVKKDLAALDRVVIAHHSDGA